MKKDKPDKEPVTIFSRVPSSPKKTKLLRTFSLALNQSTPFIAFTFPIPCMLDKLCADAFKSAFNVGHFSVETYVTLLPTIMISRAPRSYDKGLLIEDCILATSASACLPKSHPESLQAHLHNALMLFAFCCVWLMISRA